jgi:hypothetical protein
MRQRIRKARLQRKVRGRMESLRIDGYPERAGYKYFPGLVENPTRESCEGGFFQEGDV